MILMNKIKTDKSVKRNFDTGLLIVTNGLIEFQFQPHSTIDL